jgi:hypothetical protein
MGAVLDGAAPLVAHVAGVALAGTRFGSPRRAVVAAAIASGALAASVVAQRVAVDSSWTIAALFAGAAVASGRGSAALPLCLLQWPLGAMSGFAFAQRLPIKPAWAFWLALGATAFAVAVGWSARRLRALAWFDDAMVLVALAAACALAAPVALTSWDRSGVAAEGGEPEVSRLVLWPLAAVGSAFATGVSWQWRRRARPGREP